MFNKVILTFSTRTIAAFLSVANVLIGTNYLGVEGFGTISLVVLGITIYLMIQNLVTGPSIVYFFSRIQRSSIALMSYIWLVISFLLFTGIVISTLQLARLAGWKFEIIPYDYMWHNIFLAVSYGAMSIHLNLLLAENQIKSYNLVFFLQHILITISLVIFYLILNKSGLKYYLYSMYISYLISFAVAFVLSSQLIDSFKKPVFHDFIKMFKYGVVAQLASIFQLLNYRLAYYLIDIFIGRASLGVFSAATQICEGLWIFGKSIATVLFVNISNSSNLEQSRALSKRLLKFTLTVTLLPLLVLMFLPSSFYINFLGDSFGNVPFVIRWLSVGTLSLSGSAILSTYFSGSGKIRINTYGSGLGMIVTLVAGFVFVPFFGMNGAALVNTLSYFTSLLFLIYHFKKEGEISINDFILTKSDVIEVLGMLTSKIKKG